MSGTLAAVCRCLGSGDSRMILWLMVGVVVVGTLVTGLLTWRRMRNPRAHRPRRLREDEDVVVPEERLWGDRSN